MSMTREKVLNVISALLQHTETDCDYAYDNADGSVDLLPGQDIADALCLALAALLEQAGHRWIPVTERLPEEPLQTVLVTNGSAVCVGVYSVVYDEFGVMCGRGRGIDKRFGVTHWMPLSETVKEGA